MRNALRWPTTMTVSEWADRAIILLAHESSEPGPYRTDRTPYCREIQDSMALPWVRQVTFLKSTQVGGTQVGLNALGYAIDQDPGPITWVMPTREECADFGENKVRPMIEASPVLRRQLTGERWDAKRRQIRLQRCRILFRSARIPKDLASYSARWLFGDEAGKWTDSAGDEATPFELARERTRTFWNHKIFLASTPKHPGLIDKEFQRGDRRRYHVPCPHCGRFQVLRWQQVKWDKAVIDNAEKMARARDAWYECEHCQSKILDQHKQVMLARGWWCPEDIDPMPHLQDGKLFLPNDREPHRSYHLWAGYSPWLSWWEIAAKSMAATQGGDLQNFVNSWLGEPWVERLEENRPERLRECVGTYKRGDVPDGVRVLTCGVDVQKRFLVYAVRGWGFDMESWLLDHGRCGEFSQLGPLLFNRVWPRGLTLRFVFMDTNYRTRECIALAKQHPQVQLCRGVEFDDPIPMKPGQPIERNARTGEPIGNIRPWHVNVTMFKDELAASIRGAAGFGAFHVYGDVDSIYLEEMTAEHKILVEGDSRSRERWVKKAGHLQNHLWDCEVYNRAMAFRIGVQQMRGTVPAKAHRPAAKPTGRGGMLDGITLFGGEDL